MRIFLLIFLLHFSIYGVTQNRDVQHILQVMEKQRIAWNNGDLTTYMDAYWRNDSLMFIGKSGVTYGWQNTLENYKKGYPDTIAMGKLHFDILHLKRISGLYYSVVGRWGLTRKAGNLKGHFTLLFKKIGKSWLIVSDHSS